jgi:hypothetical protein
VPLLAAGLIRHDTLLDCYTEEERAAVAMYKQRNSVLVH